MRAIDTNILVRFVTSDDPKQAAAVERFLQDCEQNREPVFISTPVLCELVWVLSTGYGQKKLQVIQVLETLLNHQLFHVEHHPLVPIALDRYRNGKGNFADYLIGAIGSHAGCRDTVSFDRALRGDPGFTIL